MNARRFQSWDDFRTAALYEAGFTLAEVGRLSGGISRQAIYQRLARLEVVCRSRGRTGRHPGSVPVWQRRLAQRLVDMGLTNREAADLLGISIRTKSRRGRGGMGSHTFRLFLVQETWIERRRLILATAVCDGANIADINAISGMEYRCNNLGPFTAQLRSQLPDLPTIRRGKVVSQ